MSSVCFCVMSSHLMATPKSIHITLSEEIINASKNHMAIGAVICSSSGAYGIECAQQVTSNVKMLWEKHAGLSKDEIRGLAGVDALREVYRSLGKNPNKFVGSNEALLLRAAKGQLPKSFHPLIDVNNAFSVDFQRSIGTYDLSKIGNRLLFRVGKPGEVYSKIDGRHLDLKDLPVLCDDQGPFGSPTSDSTRAIITESTRRFIFCIFSFDGTRNLDMQTREIERALVGKLGCRFEGRCIISKECPELTGHLG